MTVIDTACYVGPDTEPDKYRLVQLVAGGGEAELWRAVTPVHGAWEQVAVKVLSDAHDAGSDRWRRRWAEQVDLLRLIHHPGVVGVHQYFEGTVMHRAGQPGDGRRLYLVMNWVSGDNLADWRVLHTSPRDQVDGIRYLLQVADVLTWLHRGQGTHSGRPVVHGDLTPANVIVNDDGQVVLVDFGLVRVARDDRTPQVAEGTRGYCAPEVIASGSYSPASDRYAFGALTVFMITGVHPPESAQEIYTLLAADPVVGGSPDLLRHLMAMFDPQPELRPEPDEWIRGLRGQTTSALSRASNDGPSHRPVWSGRRRLPALIIAAFATAVVVLLVAILLQSGSPSDPARVTADGTASPTFEAPTSPSPYPTLDRMPTVVGMPVQQALQYLQASRVTVQTRTELRDDAPADSIIGQWPAEGEELPSVAILTVARKPTPLYLASLTASRRSDYDAFRTGAAELDGKNYPRSIIGEDCYTYGDTLYNWLEFAVNNRYERFVAVVGVSPTAPRGVSAQFRVLLDDKAVFAEQLEVGDTPLTIDVPLAGAQRLTIMSDCTNMEDDAQQVWADPRLIRDPDK